MSADYMTPSLSRAARAILNWSMEDLAEKTGVASTTIRDYENGTRETTRVNRAALVAAFAGAGIEFAGGEGQTPGLLVRRAELLNNPPPPKAGRRKKRGAAPEKE
jgi:transcriptional regulator with XRE-family HTH domain